MPADGTTGLPNFKGSGDFGTSPFYGQPPGQASFSLPMRTNMARRTPKHNEGLPPIRVNKVSNIEQTRVGYRPSVSRGSMQNICEIAFAQKGFLRQRLQFSQELSALSR